MSILEPGSQTDYARPIKCSYECVVCSRRVLMNKLASGIICLVLWSGSAVAERVLDKNTVMGIHAEFTDAIKTSDMAPFKKYLYPGTKIIIDLDPSNSAGETEIKYDDYMGMLEMALPMMKDADIYEEVLSFAVDVKTNQATIREKTISTLEVMGITMRDESISETTYGIVGGKIMVLVAKDHLVSSEIIE
jgi:hypothetical protein